MTPEQILNRPRDQRRREFKYRFGQAMVFGLPVIALEYFGQSLGGSPAEAERWVAALQCLLAGWVVYVSITGMLVEGLMQLRQRVSADLVVSAGALGVYVFSLVSTAGILITGRPLYRPILFHLTVGMMVVWCGWRWWMLREGSNPGAKL